MPLWLIASFGAVIFQTLRFMLQKMLTLNGVGALGASFARFVYAAPFLWLGLAVFAFFEGLPPLNARFWMFALIGGLAQIGATICVMAVFQRRNFAVGIAFKKTEVIQTVFVGMLLIAEVIPMPAFFAILFGLVGVLFLSWPENAAPADKTSKIHQLLSPSAGLGLLSGALFAFAAVGVRGASLALPLESPFERAFICLALVVSVQVLVMGVWMIAKERQQLGALWQVRKTALLIGLTSLAGSACWFLAYTLQKAALVNAIGQAEILLSLALAHFYFREKISRREVMGMTVLSASILWLILVV